VIDRASRDRKDWELEHRLLMPDGSVKSAHVVARAAEMNRAGLSLLERSWTSPRPSRRKELRQAQVELAHISRVTTLGELTASITHELNQPIAAVVANAAAGLGWLEAEPTNPDKVRATEAALPDAQLCDRQSRKPRRVMDTSLRDLDDLLCDHFR
jgi:C4-dicarboxylate-specific signal transduction histidine kinase